MWMCMAIGAHGRAGNKETTSPRSQEGPPPSSIVMLLALHDWQIAQMDRIYEQFARVRREQGARIADWREDLRRAEAQTPPDDGRVLRLVREISAAEQRIADTYVTARAEAHRLLTFQQEETLAALRSDETVIRRDRYRDLLMLSVEDVWHSPTRVGPARRRLGLALLSRVRHSYPEADSEVVLVSLHPATRALTEPASLRRKGYGPPTEAWAARGPYTGLIVDCRGFGVERSMSPKIRVPDGSEVWGTVSVNLDWLIENGIVVYAHTLREALRLERAGANPLIVSAVGRAGGNFNSDAVVTETDADRILRENLRGKFLDRYRVIFILDAGL